MKYTLAILFSALICSECDYFASYKYEVNNQTSGPIRVEIGLRRGRDSSVVQSVGENSTREVFTDNDVPITLGCHEDSPRYGGFYNISTFVIATVDSPIVRKDFKGSGLWSYSTRDRSGIYSIVITDSSLSQ